MDLRRILYLLTLLHLLLCRSHSNKAFLTRAALERLLDDSPYAND